MIANFGAAKNFIKQISVIEDQFTNNNRKEIEHNKEPGVITGKTTEHSDDP